MLVEQWFGRKRLVTIIANRFYSIEVNKNLLVVVASIILIVVIMVIARIARICKFVNGGFSHVSIVIFFHISLISILEPVRLAWSREISGTGALRIDMIGCRILFHNTQMIRCTARLFDVVIIARGARVWRWLWKFLRSRTIKWWGFLRVKILIAVKHVCWWRWGVPLVKVETALILVLTKGLRLSR